RAPPRRSDKAGRSTGARPQADVAMGPGSVGDASDVFLELVVDVNLLARFLPREHLLGRGNRLQLVYGRRPLKTIEDHDLVGDVEVAEVDPHQKAVDLRFGEGEGAGEFNRVLRREDQEG